MPPISHSNLKYVWSIAYSSFFQFYELLLTPFSLYIMDLKQNRQGLNLFDCRTLEITTWNLNYYRCVTVTLPIISSYLEPQAHFLTHGFTKRKTFIWQVSNSLHLNIRGIHKLVTKAILKRNKWICYK